MRIKNINNLVVNKLTPKIGIEINNINLSKPLISKDIELIYKYLINNKVIFFRNQIINPKMHLTFAKYFGSIEEPHPVYPHVPKYKNIILLKNNKKNPPDTDVWHTDVTFRSEPAFASILYSKTIPPTGGDTLWSCLTAVYDSLPINIKKFIASLKAVHDMGDFRNTFTVGEKIGKAKKLNHGFKKFGSSIHSVVKIHPITKKKLLFINPGFTNHIIGLNSTDSNNLLNYLFTFMNKPEFQVRFKWTANTIAMWDNRCTMHYAIGDYMPNQRIMHRVTIKNDKRDKGL